MHLLALKAATEARDTNHATPLLATLRCLRDGLLSADAAVEVVAALLAHGARAAATYPQGFNAGESAYHTLFSLPTAARCSGGEAATPALLRLLLRADRQQGGPGSASGSAACRMPLEGVRAVAVRGGFTPLHVACRGGPGEACVEREVGAALQEAVLALCAAGADPNAVAVEPVGTGGRVVERRPLDTLVCRLLDAPVAVAGWPYTGVREWADCAAALVSCGANARVCCEETRVWLRKAGV